MQGEYYEKNKKKVLQQIKEYSQRPEIKIKTKLNKRNYAQRDYVKLKSKKYYQKNKKKISQRMKEYKSKPEIKQREKERGATLKYKLKRKAYSQKLEIKIRKRLLARIYNALKYYTKTGKIMSSKKYGMDYEKIIEHLKPFPKDLSKYHIDHIMPLCSFQFVMEDGSTNLEEVKKAFAPENHQFLLAKENLSKGGKY